MTTEQRGSSAGPEPDGLPVEPAPPDEDPTGPESAVHPTRVEQVVVPRWLQAVALEAVLFGLSALGRASRPVLLLFVVAGVIALILNPLVQVLQRVGLPGGVAIGVVLPLRASSYATGGSSPRPRCHRGGTACRPRAHRDHGAAGGLVGQRRGRLGDRTGARVGRRLVQPAMRTHGLRDT